MTLKATFLGGAREVGRLGLVLEQDDARMLFDYGLSPDKPEPSYPMEAPSVDLILLSHAHLDHSGMLPWVASRYETSILATKPSSDVATILHNDSLKIAKQEGFASKYDKGDIKHTEQVFEHIEHAQWREAAGMELHFHSAGHIPGSTMYELRGTKRILFTGDYYTENTRLLWGAHPVKADILFMESTYAGREHAKREETEKEFLDMVDDTVKKGGVAVVPSFAVGRSQEMALILKDKGYNVWIDGMAKQVAKIFMKNPKYIRNIKDLQRAYDAAKIVNHHHNRKQALKGDVILTTSGMLDGGPVLYYLKRLHGDAKNNVLLSGYQVEGTNGRMLMDTGHINIEGSRVKVEGKVKKFDFSTHAGHKDMVKFAKASGASDIVLFHGDNPDALRPDLEKFANVHTPANGETIQFKD